MGYFFVVRTQRIKTIIYLQNGCREVTPEVPSPINRSKMSGFRPVPKAEGAHCRESFDSDLRPICSSISFRTARLQVRFPMSC